ncbi:Hsp70 family protein [Dactylosporangium sp. NPDC051541]|uniref:Hsp70 family protein n=1 Tax=Dactylosporangium sp. NPDC051541 TaxID=3363977 RepID=UPI00378D384E
MTDADIRLGIDFGTSSTVAVLALPGREPRPLLFDGSPLLPSAVGVDPTGRLVVGRDALHAAVGAPGSVERYPKRCVDDGTVLLGDAECTVPALFGAVLGRVLDEATRAAGAAPGDVVITHPAAWGGERRAVLRQAIAPASVRLISEPVAAAHHLVAVAADRLPDGGTALVYDFGAGTFDATVVRRSGDGFAVLATQGRPDSGGLDIDAAIVAHVAAAVPDAAAWARLNEPATPADRRARAQLWENVRTGKESLTRAGSTLIHVPVLDVEVPLGREALDALAAPILARCTDTARAVLTNAGVEPSAGLVILLVGGASRMPAVAATLHREFGTEPLNLDQPELAVAEGSLRAGDAAVDAADDSSDWPRVEPLPALAPARPRRTRLLLAAGAGLAVAAAITAVALADGPSKPGALAPSASASSASPEPSAAPPRTYPAGVDPCLLGRWRSVAHRNYGTIDGKKVQYTGPGGVVAEFREDGTVINDYDPSAPDTANVGGVIWEAKFRGQTTSHYFAANGEIQATITSTNVRYTLNRNGKLNNEAASIFNLETEKYTCTATRLIETSSLGEWSADSERIA